MDPTLKAPTADSQQQQRERQPPQKDATAVWTNQLFVNVLAVLLWVRIHIFAIFLEPRVQFEIQKNGGRRM